MKLKSISPSRIKTFDTCLFKYFLTYHCPSVKLKSNWGAVHGSLLHDILEHCANGCDPDWTARLYDGYSGSLNTLDRDGNSILLDSPLLLAKDKEFKDKKPYCDTCPHRGDGICEISGDPLYNLRGCPRSLFENSVSMLQSTIDRYQNTIWKNILRNNDGAIIGTEYPLNIIIDGTDVPLVGIMDLVIEEDPETIHVIDYKTGSWVQDYKECREDIQVKAYSMGSRREFIEDVNNKGYKYKNVILTFDYFTDYPITLAFSAEEDAATELFIKKKIKQIESTEWITRIVKSNEDFGEKWAWKCRSLCDTEVCAANWGGTFKA